MLVNCNHDIKGLENDFSTKIKMENITLCMKKKKCNRKQNNAV